MSPIAALVLAAALSARAQVPAAGPGAPVSAKSLMAMDEAQLEALYARSPAGPIPDGAAAGFANRAPGSGFGAFTRELYAGLWQGKTFDRARGVLINRTVFGEVADARVYLGASRSDGKPAILLDYSKSRSLLARLVKDEIREVSPGLYLGVAYLGVPPGAEPRKWLWFALEFPR